MSDGAMVRAAGGVIMRHARGGELQVLLVYRNKRRDWTFPKGKVEPGETDEACAVREVAEETGLQCALGEELGSTTYIDRKGRDKVVRYWAMYPLAGTAAPLDEVDAVLWVSVPRAVEILTHDRDRALLGMLCETSDKVPSLTFPE